MYTRERGDTRSKRVKITPSLALRKEKIFPHTLLALVGGCDTLMVFSLLYPDVVFWAFLGLWIWRWKEHLQAMNFSENSYPVVRWSSGFKQVRPGVRFFFFFSFFFSGVFLDTPRYQDRRRDNCMLLVSYSSAHLLRLYKGVQASLQMCVSKFQENLAS